MRPRTPSEALTPSVGFGLTSERASEELRSREIWLSGQRRAFELALGEAPLAEPLQVLVETATDVLAGEVQAAFYLTAADGKTLRHVVGMSDDHIRAVDGIEIGLESITRDRAPHGGEVDLTSVLPTDSRREPWIWMAEKFGYRGCWRLPIHTTAGNFVGALALYWPEPREISADDLDRAELITQTAAIIIARYKEAERRKATEERLRETQSQLQKELEDSELLRQISVELAVADDENALYRKLVEAAAKIMHSDVCTVQIFHPERGPAGELQMLASTGLNAEGMRYWEWVRGDSGCTCGEVLRTGRRAIAEDVETCSFMAGTPDREVLLAGGIRAGQSTPLVTRNGKLVGMISTHWGKPHQPSSRDLRMLDILARPTADLIERKRAAETQRLLLNELNHRVKNTLAVVQAMATRTLSRTSDPKEFAKSFGGRVQALARIHDMLGAKSWEGADLRDLIQAQTSSGSVDETRLTAVGPDVRLDPQMALHLALVFHELGTNAIKYGALSMAAGMVTVEWTVDDALRICWTERGGPHVVSPSSKGFGSMLIDQSIKGQGGEALMTSEHEGVRWDITLPYASGIADRDRSVQAIALPLKTSGDDYPGSLKGRRLLVIEDEPLIGMDIIAALEDAGADVEGPVASIDEACALIERLRFDGALVDANLRGQPVDAIAIALSARNVPFAFATGYGKDGLPQGFRDIPILSKPFGPEQVVAAAIRLLTPGIASKR